MIDLSATLSIHDCQHNDPYVIIIMLTVAFFVMLCSVMLNAVQLTVSMFNFMLQMTMKTQLGDNLR
jgi:hypothetical protein